MCVVSTRQKRTEKIEYCKTLQSQIIKAINTWHTSMAVLQTQRKTFGEEQMGAHEFSVKFVSHSNGAEWQASERKWKL